MLIHSFGAGASARNTSTLFPSMSQTTLKRPAGNYFLAKNALSPLQPNSSSSATSLRLEKAATFRNAVPATHVGGSIPLDHWQ